MMRKALLGATLGKALQLNGASPIFGGLLPPLGSNQQSTANPGYEKTVGKFRVRVREQLLF